MMDGGGCSPSWLVGWMGLSGVEMEMAEGRVRAGIWLAGCSAKGPGHTTEPREWIALAPLGKCSG